MDATYAAGRARVRQRKQQRGRWAAGSRGTEWGRVEGDEVERGRNEFEGSVGGRADTESGDRIEWPARAGRGRRAWSRRLGAGRMAGGVRCRQQQEPARTRKKRGEPE
jgi:hypothetical protein